MDQAPLPGMLQPFRHLPNAFAGPCDRRGAALAEQIGEALAFGILHHQEVRFTDGIGIECRHDVRVIEGRDRLNFLLKPGQRRAVPAQFPRQQFERDGPPEGRMLREKHRPHAPGADLVEQLVAAEEKRVSPGQQMLGLPVRQPAPGDETFGNDSRFRQAGTGWFRRGASA